MEKRKPHYSLSRLKELVKIGSYRVTRTALRCASDDFGLPNNEAIAKHVLTLEANEFYKSMTTHTNTRLWQDVYHHNVDGAFAYLKVQIDDDETVVISFKRLEER